MQDTPVALSQLKSLNVGGCSDTIGTALKVERFIKNQDRKIKLLLVENPEDLKSRVLKNMEKELILLPFDALTG